MSSTLIPLLCILLFEQCATAAKLSFYKIKSVKNLPGDNTDLSKPFLDIQGGFFNDMLTGHALWLQPVNAALSRWFLVILSSKYSDRAIFMVLADTGATTRSRTQIANLCPTACRTLFEAELALLEQCQSRQNKYVLILWEGEVTLHHFESVCCLQKSVTVVSCLSAKLKWM